MLASQSKKLVLKAINDIVSRQAVDGEALNRIVHPDFALHVPYSPTAFKGVAGLKRFLNEVFSSAFVDASLTVEDVLADKEKVCVRLTLRGRQQGELFNMPPHGERPVTICIITIWHLEDNKIKEIWSTDTFFWSHPEC